MKQCSNTILDFIGNTPLVQIGDTFIKCEYMNPSGSIKARIAKFLIEKAEEEGILSPGDTIVEATSGNTGNAMSMVAAVKGYKMVVVMPADFSSERVSISRAFGAQVRLVGHFDVSEALEEAKKLGKQKGFWCPQQFDNEWNVEENEHVLGEEIIHQLPESIKIDAIVQGVGTGGTLIGVSKALKKLHNPNLKVFAMEPDEAALIKCGEFREHLIEGISDGFIPGIITRHKKEIDEVITVEGVGAIEQMRYLASNHGMFIGPSSGANWLASQKIREKYPEIKNILTFFCDEGEKYIMQHFGAHE
jgi:cysteine synthase A